LHFEIEKRSIFHRHQNEEKIKEQENKKKRGEAGIGGVALILSSTIIACI
jgi:hypothetical protein